MANTPLSKLPTPPIQNPATSKTSSLYSAPGKAHSGRWPIGTIRKWQNGTFQKIAQGQWVPYDAGELQTTKFTNNTSAANPDDEKDKIAAASMPKPDLDTRQWAGSPIKDKEIDVDRGGSLYDRDGHLRQDGVPVIPEVPINAPWVLFSDSLPKNTLMFYMKNGVVDPKRQELYDQIIKHFFDGVEKPGDDDKKLAILTMGGPLSGKSSIHTSVPEQYFVIISIGEIRKFIPEYKEAIKAKAKNAIELCQDECVYIGRLIKAKATHEGYHLLYDGTGYDHKKYEGLVHELLAKDYHTHIIMTDYGISEALFDNQSRSLKTGFIYDESDIRKVYSALPPNFILLSEVVSSFILLKNGSSVARIWEKTDNGQEKIYHKDYVNEFKRQQKNRYTESRLFDILKCMVESGVFDFDGDSEMPIDLNEIASLVESEIEEDRKHLLGKSNVYSRTEGIHDMPDTDSI